MAPLSKRHSFAKKEQLQFVETEFIEWMFITSNSILSAHINFHCFEKSCLGHILSHFEFSQELIVLIVPLFDEYRS